MNLLKNQTDEIKSSNMDFDYLTEQFDFEDDGLPDFRVRTPIFKRVGIAAGIFAVLVGMYLFLYTRLSRPSQTCGPCISKQL